MNGILNDWSSEGVINVYTCKSPFKLLTWFVVQPSLWIKLQISPVFNSTIRYSFDCYGVYCNTVGVITRLGAVRLMHVSLFLIWGAQEKEEAEPQRLYVFVVFISATFATRLRLVLWKWGLVFSALHGCSYYHNNVLLQVIPKCLQHSSAD